GKQRPPILNKSQHPNSEPPGAGRAERAMVQGYYTLEEAARILKMTSEDLTQMAQKRQIRAFADRGTWRFRSQDVEEIARRRGQSSDEVQSLAATTPADAPKAKTEKHEEVFNFNIS